ncbi:MAG: sigma-54 dependent transcriptional regulator [Candidatus Aminicenantes bacterium]|jgi:DNA-binding NtrC family response regulator
MNSILVISKEQEILRIFRSSFQSQYRLAKASDINSAIEILQKRRYDFIFIDLKILEESIPGNEYEKSLQPFWHLFPTVEIIIMSSREMIRESMAAIKAGASDFIAYPLNPEELRYLVKNIHESKIMHSELDHLRKQFWQPEALEVIQTKNPVMQKVFDKIRAVAPTKSTVLLTGETGTGKGVLAHLIHQHSNRRDKQFISVHCGAIPDTLLESELFGHEKGSFTGADRRKLGKFEIANGGTIFLDEIGTITPSAQIKLLQILQDQTFQRVGGEEVLKTDTRVIAATNTDLKRMCEERQFRKDLYYRLNVFPVEVPPLRERMDDLPHLAKIILNKTNKIHLKKIHSIHPLVMEAFLKYDWPGNIRELENIIERAYILENTPVLTPESFPTELIESSESSTFVPIDSSLSLAEFRQKAVEEIETNYLKNLLTENKGRINTTAAAAGVSTRQLHKLMIKYGLRKEEFKS